MIWVGIMRRYYEFQFGTIHKLSYFWQTEGAWVHWMPQKLLRCKPQRPIVSFKQLSLNMCPMKFIDVLANSNHIYYGYSSSLISIITTYTHKQMLTILKLWTESNNVLRLGLLLPNRYWYLVLGIIYVTYFEWMRCLVQQSILPTNRHPKFIGRFYLLTSRLAIANFSIQREWVSIHLPHQSNDMMREKDWE